jgi:hypothetical protein
LPKAAVESGAMVPIKPESAAMVEMCIAGEEDRHPVPHGYSFV